MLVFWGVNNHMVVRSYTRPVVLALLGLALLGAADNGVEPLVLPGTEVLVVETPHLRAFVPKGQAEQLRPLVARAEQLYVHLAADAGVEPSRLTLLFDDNFDDHNGYSSTVPDRVIAVWLAPAPPRSQLFSGDAYLERTLVHEFTHHLANDRNHGFRAVLESVFGRIMPTEPFSMVMAYLSAPAHVTMPSFWQEGQAQWVETVYADAASPWAGRGRDSLTHAMWRLDAADRAIPDVSAWRPSTPTWPFGTRPYLYGLAYTRWLEAAYGSQASVWRITDDQARQWAFCFDGGAEGTLGSPHTTLIRRMVVDLQAEQDAHITVLRQQPVTSATRLNPPDTVVGPPAWGADGRLVAAWVDPWGADRLTRFAADGTRERTWLSISRASEVRSVADGALVYADVSTPLSPVALSGGFHDANEILVSVRSRVVLVERSGRVRVLDGRRYLQPDARVQGNGHQVAAVHLLPAGRQELTLCTVAAEQSAWTVFPTQGRAWSPAFRPGHDELAWVEVDDQGSRLVLAPLAEPANRTVIASVRGRIMHPAWSADGSALYLCADHRGVANAFQVRVAEPGRLIPVTNTLGAVTACVPSPDGTRLALLDLDRHGPRLGIISAEPGTWPAATPALDLAWPARLVAPAPAVATATDPKIPSPLPEEAPAAAGPAEDYHGWAELRPLFWTPTTAVTARGGYGVVGILSDPLHTHSVVGAVGAGPNESTLVGTLAATTTGGWVQAQAVGWRDERTYEDQVVDRYGRLYDYTENVTAGELRIGQGLAGTRRRVFGYVAVGLANHQAVERAVERYAPFNPRSLPVFDGQERYAEVVVGYASSTIFPTSYTREDGPRITLALRQSGADGDLTGRSAQLGGSWVFSVWPKAGHQLVVGGVVGWSDLEGTWLQQRFQVGGNSGLDLPRGYPTLMAQGEHLLGWTTAYRMPLFRPFSGASTTPFAFRQLVLEGFCDGAKASNDRPGGAGTWYRSAGGEVRADVEIWYLQFAPGLGLARQLDGGEDTVAYFTLEFTW